MSQAYFRFYTDLNYFLPSEKQKVMFAHKINEDASIKDTIEAIGVPHPEVDVILVNGKAVDFSYQVQPEDIVSVYPLFTSFEKSPKVRVGPPPLPKQQVRFVLDTHLGRLASHLRMLGFDTLYQNDYEDAELARISSEASRILLTRDLGLLKRSIVTYGYFVRQTNPDRQIVELLRRFDLLAHITPFQRCARCNGHLQPVQKELIRHRLNPQTREQHDQFQLCDSCQQIYWRGSHVERIEAWIERVREEASQ
ncbi:MAG: Mut7-C RNAse domain-containing protein, partial [Ardenticatenaceae bacterium]